MRLAALWSLFCEHAGQVDRLWECLLDSLRRFIPPPETIRLVAYTNLDPLRSYAYGNWRNEYHTSLSRLSILPMYHG